MFKRVGTLIRPSIRYSKSENVLSALRIRQICQESIGRMCRDDPVDLVKKIKVTSYKNGVLTVLAPTIAGAELHMRSGELIDDINGRFGKKVLRSIKFKQW